MADDTGKKGAKAPPAKSERDKMIDQLQTAGLIVDKRWDDARLREEIAALSAGTNPTDALAADGGDAGTDDGVEVDLAPMQDHLVTEKGATKAICLQKGLHIAPDDLVDAGTTTKSRKFALGEAIYFRSAAKAKSLEAQKLVRVV